MPTITGTLSDIGLAPLTGLSPELRFTPSSSAVDGNGRVFASEPVTVSPNSAGAFSVELASTLNLVPKGTHWLLSLHWRGGTADGEGFPATDFPPLKVFVGTDDVSIADAVAGDPKLWASLFHVGTEPPAKPVSGLIWIDTSGEVALIKKWKALR